MKKPIPRTPYSEKPKTAIKFKKTEGLTKQSFATECDINNVMANVKATGFTAHVKSGTPRYGNDQEYDFHDAQLMMANLKSAYESLPADKRGSFASVSDFVQAMTDPEREQELVDKGIIIVESETMESQPINENPETAQPTHADPETPEESTA